MSTLTDQDWLKFQSVLDGANGSLNQKQLIWYRYLSPLDINLEDFGEINKAQLDNPTQYSKVYLKALLNYNYMRTWPVDQNTQEGKLDRQSLQVFLNKTYLKSLNYLTGHTNFDYNPDFDRFVIDGLLYRPVGDTSASQAGAIDIFYLLILQREESETTEYTIR